MNRYTEKELWDFVNRAQTKTQIEIAVQWLHEHGEMRDGTWELWDELMRALSRKHRLLKKEEEEAHRKPYAI